MPEMYEISGLMGWIALLLPVAALLTVAALALRRGRSRGSKTKPPGNKKPLRDTSARETGAASISEIPGSGALDEEDGRDVGAASRLKNAVTDAERREDERALAELYLALGRQQRGNGNAGAADVLRKSIRLATRFGQHETHASARLELGDIAEESGDLTTACEHWQIARGLFHERPSAELFAAAETRMRRNGCPTDWVLNDF